MEYYLKTETSYLGKISIDIDDLLKKCSEEIKDKLDKTPPIIIFGKPAIQHRNVGFFSIVSGGYAFAGQSAEAKPLTNSLILLLNYINELFDENFNGILINEYINGNDYIGKHSDKENGLSKSGVICLSYGANRKFRIRNKENNNIIMDVKTNSREILIMGGNFQKEFTHEIPVEKKIKESRISFTFRCHK